MVTRRHITLLIAGFLFAGGPIPSCSISAENAPQPIPFDEDILPTDVKKAFELLIDDSLRNVFSQDAISKMKDISDLSANDLKTIRQSFNRYFGPIRNSKYISKEEVMPIDKSMPAAFWWIAKHCKGKSIAYLLDLLGKPTDIDMNAGILHIEYQITLKDTGHLQFKDNALISAGVSSPYENIHHAATENVPPIPAVPVHRNNAEEAAANDEAEKAKAPQTPEPKDGKQPPPTTDKKDSTEGKTEGEGK